VIADRTACSILTLFIAIATSRPLNKEIRSLSVRWSNNYCGSASAIRSPHTSAAPAGCRLQSAPCHCWQTSRGFSTLRHTCSLNPYHIYGVSHFVFLWCILWLNDTSYSKSVWRDK